MSSSVCAILFLLPLAFAAHDEFVFNRFNGDGGWAIDGSAAVLPNGVLSLGPTQHTVPFSAYGAEVGVWGQDKGNSVSATRALFLIWRLIGRRKHNKRKGGREREYRAVTEVTHARPLIVLVDFVLRFWQNDLIICIVDPRLGGEYVREEAELVLKLGLLCSHPSPVGRPSMRLIMQYLCGDFPFPAMPDAYLNIRSINELQVDGDFGEDDLQCPSLQTSITGLSGGR